MLVGSAATTLVRWQKRSNCASGYSTDTGAPAAADNRARCCAARRATAARLVSLPVLELRVFFAGLCWVVVVMAPITGVAPSTQWLELRLTVSFSWSSRSPNRTDARNEVTHPMLPSQGQHCPSYPFLYVGIPPV